LPLPQLKFHHFGLALKSDADALLFLEALEYTISDLVYDPHQNVNLRLCEHPSQPDIEIVLPGDGPGPLTPILRRYEGLIYHTCYESADPAAYLQALDELGIDYAEVAPPKPAILLGGRLVSFYQIKGFGLIELIWPESSAANQ
jgi:hypothetical protein